MSEVKNTEIYSERMNHSLYETVVTRGMLESVLNAPKGDVLTYGATPLDRVGTVVQQIGVRDTLQERTFNKIPHDIPMEIADYVHSTFTKRFDARGEANEENFITCLRYDTLEELDPLVQEMVERAKNGHASPTELLLLRDTLGVRSIELACLTHPYGENITMLDDMRESVHYAVELFGGEYFSDSEPVFAAKESIGDEYDAVTMTYGVLMTRKRVIGHMADGTVIKERSSFVLRTDEMGAVVDAQREAMFAVDPNDPEWSKKVVALEGLDAQLCLSDTIKFMLDNNHFSLAIPISTTIYAFNERTAQEVLKKQKTDEVAKQLRFKLEQPGLIAALEDARRPQAAEPGKQLRESFSFKGMHVNAPEAIKKQMED